MLNKLACIVSYIQLIFALIIFIMSVFTEEASTIILSIALVITTLTNIIQNKTYARLNNKYENLLKGK